jgi:hypothetical protein
LPGQLPIGTGPHAKRSNAHLDATALANSAVGREETSVACVADFAVPDEHFDFALAA